MVDAINPDYRALWSLACQDAGKTEAAVVLELRDIEGDPERTSTMYGWPAGSLVGADALDPPLEPEAVERLRQAHALPRLAVAGRLESPALLALMRNGLALLRLSEEDEPAYKFAWGPLDAALSGKYSRLGRGGGVIHNAHPSMRDANRAAGMLVLRTQGPQPGSLNGPFGILFRPGQDFGGASTLRARLTVFAAMHAEAMLDMVGSDYVDETLERLDDLAPSWWYACLQDDGFNHLRGSIPYFIPSADDIAEAGSAPANVWRPLADLLDRALIRGLAVIGAMT